MDSIYIAFFQVIDYNNEMSGAVPEGGPLVPYHRASGPLLFNMRKYFRRLSAAYFLLQKFFKKNLKKIQKNY